MGKRRLLAFLLVAAIVWESVLPTYAVNVTDTLSGEEITIAEIMDETQTEGKELLQSTSVVEAEEEEPDYILGRKMIEEEIAAQKAMVPKLTPMEPVDLDTDDLYAGMEIGAFEEQEEKYDARDKNIITPVKNQNPWGTCWAFSTMSLMETSLIMQGVANQDEIDLSERHLAYFTANTGYDALGNASEDTITPPTEDYYLNSGGTITNAAMRLMNWQGAAAEEAYPYSNEAELPEIIAPEQAQEKVAVAKEFYIIPTKGVSVEDEVTVIKNMIKTYGSVWWSYHHDDRFMNYDTGAYNCNEALQINHAVTFVGWDDTYSKENFTSGCKPENDGAWIVKNSWDTWFGDEGYFYISYEDLSLGEGNDAGVLIAGEADEFDNNYFYGNGIYYSYYPDCWQTAQIYEAKSKAEQEILKAVSIMMASAKETYEIQIYKNPKLENGVVVNPESGEAMYDTPVAGETGYAGLYTIDVPPVILEKGNTFAIVVSFTDADGASIFIDGTYEQDYADKYQVAASTNITKAGQSFRHPIPHESGYDWGWQDLHTGGNSFRINALTVDAGKGAPVVNYKTIQQTKFTDTRKNVLNWTACIDAAQYEIYRADEENGKYTKIGEVSNDTLTYKDELSLESWENTYFYKVKVVFTDNTEAESEVLKIVGNTTLPMSEISVNTKEEGNIISWESIDGADGYEIERKLPTEENFTLLTVIENGNAVSYTDTQKTTYEYRVRAYTEEGIYTVWSNVEMSDNVFAELECVEYGGEYTYNFKVTWEAMEEAASYMVWVTGMVDGSPSSLGWTAQNGATNVTAALKYFESTDAEGNVVTGVGEEFTFEVVPKDASGVEITPNFYKKIKKIWTPMPLQNVSHEETDGVTFTWTGAKNAEFIEVYRSSEENNKGEEVYATIDLQEGTSYTDKNVEKGKVYYYWFVPGVINNAGEKVYSDLFSYCVMMESDLDTTKLVELITEYKTLKNENGTYSEESWNAFQTAINKAEEGVDSLTTKEEVAKAIADLKAAKDALVEMLTVTKEGIWVDGIKELIYTGEKQILDLKVYDKSVLLEEGKDYTVTYKNNINAYIYGEEDGELFTKSKSKAPKAIIKMKGNYSASKDIYFKILPMELNGNVLVDDLSGSQQEPKANVIWNGKALKEGKDYEIVYHGKNEDTGKYSLTIKGLKNFGGELTKEYTVEEDTNYISMSLVKVATIKPQKWQEGGVELDFSKIKLTYKGKNLSLDEFYVDEYKHNEAVGTAYVVLQGMGVDNDQDRDNYAFIGTKIISFKISGTSMAKVKVENLLNKYYYTGVEIEPLDLLGKNDNEVEVTCKLKDENGKIYTYPLSEGPDSDYTVTYQKHIDKGTATMILTGNPARGFTGIKKVNFKIAQQSMKNYTIDNVEYDTEALYMKGGAKPKVVLMNEVTAEPLVEGKDYTISYKNNKKIGTASLCIKGKGNYNQSTEWFSFDIVEKDLTEENGITVVAKDKELKQGQETKWKQSFKVYDADGKVLSANKDYVKIAEYAVIEDGEGNVLETPQILKDGDSVETNSVIQITVTGINNYDTESGISQVTGTYRILEPGYDISKAKIKINGGKSIAYTGEAIILKEEDIEVSIKIGKETKYFTLGEEFIIDPEEDYVNNVNKGTAKVTIHGNVMKDFGGEKTVTFKISQRDVNKNWWENFITSAESEFEF